MAPPRKTIDQLPEQSVYEGTNYLVVQDEGVTKKMAASLIVSQTSPSLQAHLDDTTDAHDASAVSATASGPGVDGTNVQAQLGQVATLIDAIVPGITAEDAIDAVAVALTEGVGVDIVYDDTAGTITVTADKTEMSLTKADVGLSNVDNTADVDKPVSTAQAAADALKADKATTIATTAPLIGGGDLTTNRTLGINAFAGSAPGAVPASPGGTVNFLRADGAWMPPPDTGLLAASDAETIAGTLATKAVTPDSREAASTDIDPRKYGFAAFPATDGVANSAALQAAIDEACGTGNPVTTTRTANRRVVLPAGIYFLDSPINIRSVLGLVIEGHGNAELRANANMTSIFDINGMAYSRIGGFTITGSAGVTVDNGIYLYWDAAGASRTTTLNCFHDITIRNLNFVTGFRAGKPAAAVQVDNDEYRNITISGAWTTGEASRYQNGLLLGSGVAANNLVHSVYKFLGSNVRYPIKVEQTEVAVYGAGIAGCDTAIYCQANGYASFSGFDIEACERLFFTPASTANVNVTLSDMTYRANTMRADGRWIDFNMAGTLHLKQLYCKNPAVIPIIDTGGNPIRVDVEGLAIIWATALEPDDCFILGAQAVARVRGFVNVNASGVVTAVKDWDSDYVAPVTPDPTMQIDVFNSGTSTWTKPTWAKTVRIALIAGTSGGGSGRRGAAGTVRCGGGGAGGSAWTVVDFAAADLEATLSVTIGGAGVGGAAVATDDTNGAPGTSGGATFVRSPDLSKVYCRADPGLNGGGGTVSAGTGGAAGPGLFAGGSGAAASTSGLVGATGTSAQGGGGGGSGGGITTGNAASAGGAGGSSSFRQATATAAGGAIGTSGTAPANVIGANTAAPQHGCSGGGSSITAAAGAGGDATAPGMSGGGGGASLNGFASGKGGDGFAGRAVITSFG